MDRSTTGRSSGVSLRLDLFTSPVSPFPPIKIGKASWRAMTVFGWCPASRTPPDLTPFHADPVARAIKIWCQADPSSRVQLGCSLVVWFCTIASLPYADPKADVQFGCFADPIGFPNDSAGLRLRPIPEGTLQLGPTSHLDQLPDLGADSPLFVFHPKVQYELGLRWL